MNRRAVTRGMAGAVIATAAPAAARAVDPHNDHPYQLRDYISARGARAVSYRAYDAKAGILTSGMLWISAYAVVGESVDDAERVAANLPRAIHDCTAFHAPKGSLTGPLYYTAADTPGGVQQAEAWTWRTPEGDAALTMMRVGELVQVVYGPTSEDPRKAIDALTLLAAATLVHWPDAIGEALIPLAEVLPSLDDLPSGTVISDEVLVTHPWPGR